MLQPKNLNTDPNMPMEPEVNPTQIPVDSENANVEIPKQTSSVSKTDELVKRFYSAEPPKPSLDQGKLDRINKLGRINTISKGVNVLGDILSLGLGANVRKAGPDTVTPELARQYQATLDKYKGDKDIYEMRNFQKTREDALFGLNRADHDKANERADALLKAQTDAAKSKAQQDWTKFLAGLNAKDQDRAAKLKMAKERNNIDLQKLEFEKKKVAEGTEKPFNMVSYNGIDKPLTQGEHRAMLAKAQSTSEFYNDDLKAQLSAYENSPLEGDKNIVQRFYQWQKAKDAKENPTQPTYMMKGAATPGFNPMPNIPKSTPVAPASPAQSGAKKIDWSKKKIVKPTK